MLIIMVMIYTQMGRSDNQNLVILTYRSICSEYDSGKLHIVDITQMRGVLIYTYCGIIDKVKW